MMLAVAKAEPDTLEVRDIERRAYDLLGEIEARDGDYPSDLGMAARLFWMEAGRVLERHCERDGISRFNYRWPR